MTLLLIFSAATCADGNEPKSAEAAARDSAFVALQERGATPQGMGVDHRAMGHDRH